MPALTFNGVTEHRMRQMSSYDGSTPHTYMSYLLCRHANDFLIAQTNKHFKYDSHASKCSYRHFRGFLLRGGQSSRPTWISHLSFIRLRYCLCHKRTSTAIDATYINVTWKAERNFRGKTRAKLSEICIEQFPSFLRKLSLIIKL